LAREQYIKRHDSMCVQLHCNTCKKIRGKLDNKQWYDHVPKSNKTSHEGKVTILWNQPVRAERTIPNNKPNITICDNKKGTCMLIDIAIPGNRNAIKKEATTVVP